MKVQYSSSATNITKASEHNPTTHAFIITAAASITTACTTIEAAVLLAAPLVEQATDLLPASAVTVQEAVVLDAAGIKAVGRAVDLTRLDGYGDLLMKLDMFEIEGELRGSTKKWLVVYTNDEDDMMMVGYDLGSKPEISPKHTPNCTSAASITTACTTIEAAVLLTAPLVEQATDLLPASAVTVQEAVVLAAAGIKAVGRAVDLTRLDGYGDLLMKLDMFEIEGELRGSTKKWLVVYTNDEDDMMMVGYDLWQ
ncbi:Auxin response factor 7 [Capsicum baccatum]|uniref:Auxin response factor 7 n=1 Tax=Capsicum baccatum TaxID=33114 RepID=A0A2G2W4I4_CAPBA|nr:Auxin response factor 7 [Capsicum baccatum]